MLAHLHYLSYVLRHKWFVFWECVKLGIIWRGIIHDLSKFRWSEWLPYVRYFYGKYPKWDDVKRILPAYDGPTEESVTGDFDIAWLLHQHRNPHHWQYWLLIQDDESDKILPMPDKYRREMLADWRGAGQACGTPDTYKWYLAHKDKIQLHPETRLWIERQLGIE